MRGRPSWSAGHMKIIVYVLFFGWIATCSSQHVASAAQSSVLQVSAQLRIPRAPGFFDYMIVDAPKHRLIVSHTGSNAVAFIDTSSGELERQLYVGAAHG